MIRFGKFPERSIADMGSEACLSALKHAGMKHNEVEAAFAGNIGHPPNVAQRILDVICVLTLKVFVREIFGYPPKLMNKVVISKLVTMFLG